MSVFSSATSLVRLVDTLGRVVDTLSQVVESLSQVVESHVGFADFRLHAVKTVYHYFGEALETAHVFLTVAVSGPH